MFAIDMSEASDSVWSEGVIKVNISLYRYYFDAIHAIRHIL